MWLTVPVEDNSRLALQGTLVLVQELTAAESIRQLPTLRLFKIRMDLEMQGGTEQLAAAAAIDAQPPTVTKQPVDEFDRAVIRAPRRALPVTSDPSADAAAALGITQPRLLGHMEGMVERRLLRPVAA